MSKWMPLSEAQAMSGIDVREHHPRASARRRVLKSGVISFCARHASTPCTVRDLSETGARLKVTGSVAAPDTFELHVELDGIWVDCEVVWRRNSELGVAFVSPIKRVTPKRKQVVSIKQPESRPTLRRKTAVTV
ncbi:MAG: PilZ domain-containing protein [Filomicrobium sp.]